MRTDYFLNFLHKKLLSATLKKTVQLRSGALFSYRTIEKALGRESGRTILSSSPNRFVVSSALLWRCVGLVALGNKAQTGAFRQGRM